MKKNRKLLAVLLSVALILTLVPLALFANAADYESYLDADGNAKLAAGNYEISNADELTKLAAAVNSGTAEYGDSSLFKLTADIDLAGAKWTPIGTESNPFTASFDGANFTVSNFYMDDSYDNNGTTAYRGGLGGLFGWVAGKIDNLSVKDADFTFGGVIVRVGAIAAVTEESATITNCSSMNVSIDISNPQATFTLNYAGGIVGSSSGPVSKCFSTADISIDAPTTISNYAGGIVGYSNGNITDAYYTGTVVVGESLIGGVGGIAGTAVTGTIKNCYSVGIINGKNAAGIVSVKNADVAVENCHYYDGTADAGWHTVTSGVSTPGSDGCTTFTTLVPATLGDSFKSSSSLYPFPELIGNKATLEPVENTTEFAGGKGTIYDPYKISTSSHLNNVRKYLTKAFKLSVDSVIFYDYDYSDKATNIAGLEASIGTDLDALKTELGGVGSLSEINIGNLSDTALQALRAKVKNLGALSDGEFIGGFKPIGTVGDPFRGHFDGDGKKIFNLVINETGTYAGLFICNAGTIKDVTLTTTGDESASDYSLRATTPASVSLTATGEVTAGAAAVAVINNGTISGVNNDIDVTVTSENFKVLAAGITATNNGTVTSSSNTGIILAKFADSAFAGKNYSELAAGAEIKVAGIAAVNAATGKVTDCQSTASARSEFTSADTEDGIMEAQYVAENLGTNTGNLAATSPTKTYLSFNLPDSYTRTSEPYATTGNPLPNNDTQYGAQITNGSFAADNAAVPDYEATANNNYQKVTLNFTDDQNNSYRSVFLAWLNLEKEDLTVDVSEADKDFLVGDAFSSDGIKVTAYAGDPRETVINESASNGYSVEVYDAETAGNRITDFANASAGKYYVRVIYGADVLTTYEVNIYDIARIEIASVYGAYMAGQNPTIEARAYYADPAQTAKPMTTFNYYILDAADGLESATSANNAFSATGDKFLGVKYTDTNGAAVLSNTVGVTVLASDVTVTDLKAITSSDEGSTVTADNIRLEWTDPYAQRYTVYRSSDNWATQSVVRTVSQDYCNDTNTVPGVTYKYKVVMRVAGQDSTGAAELEVTAPMPTSIEVISTSATKYFPLSSDFKTTGLRVNAVYKNGTKESLTSSTDQNSAGTKYYYINTNYNKDVPGEYTVDVMYNGEKQGETYTVEVVPPTAINVTANEFDAYPVGYAEASFKDALTVKASYDSAKIRSTYTVDSADFGVTDYATAASTAGEKTITVTYATKNSDNQDVTLTTTVDTKFVPNVPPATVSATAGNTGTNQITWSEVEGAVSYNVYRAEGSDPAPEAYTRIKSGIKSATTYTDEQSLPGNTYTYKVSAVIADSETAQSAATSSVVTVAPAFVKADVSGTKRDYAVGDSLNVTGIKVYAYYYTAATGSAEDTDFAAIESNANYTQRQLSSTTDTAKFGYSYTTAYDRATAGTYAVSVTVDGNAVYNSQTIGEYSVTVYPVYKVSIEMDNAAYPLNYPLSADDFTVRIVYGTEGKDVKTTATSVYSVVAEPNMAVLGEQSITVMYNNDPTLTATATFNVYDPAAEITLTGESKYKADDTYVKNIQPNTTVATLKTNLENDDSTIVIVDSRGTEITRSYLATGDKIRLVVSGTVVDSKTVVVLGDATGDGRVNTGDVTRILNSLSGRNVLRNEYELAADANGNGTSNTGDATRLLGYLSGGNKTLGS